MAINTYGSYLMHSTDGTTYTKLLDIKDYPDMIEAPMYRGVTGMGEGFVEVLISCKCEENDFYQVQRDLSHELFTVFKENGIAFPTLRVVMDESSSIKL